MQVISQQPTVGQAVFCEYLGRSGQLTKVDWTKVGLEWEDGSKEELTMHQLAHLQWDGDRWRI